MDNRELAEINASMQALVRRAYDLGRTESLKRIVDVLSADRPPSEKLALMAPDKIMPAEPEYDVEHASNGHEPPSEKPWWAWPVR